MSRKSKKKPTKTTSTKKNKKSQLSASQLATLEDERNSLLDALEDLEREHQAGDLTDEDYHTLSDDYTVRAAEKLRAIDTQTVDREPRQTGSWTRRAAVWTVVAVLAVGAGFGLAQTIGERGVDDALTGDVDQSQRGRIVECRQFGEGGDLLAAVECFDEVLEADPTNVDALTYRGWFRILQVDSLSAAGDEAAAATLLDAGLVDLDAAIASDDTVPDPYVFRSVAQDRLGQTDLVCSDINRLEELNAPPFYMTQVSSIAAANGCPLAAN